MGEEKEEENLDRRRLGTIHPSVVGRFFTGVNNHQLVYWKKRYLKTETDVSFVPVRLEDLLDIPTQTDQASLSLVIDNHFKVEIRDGFDPKLLRQVIFALRAAI
jgi:hypothetical protein